jgi:hypothetical protein
MTTRPERRLWHRRRLILPLAALAIALAVGGVTTVRGAQAPTAGPLSGGNQSVEAGVGLRSLSLGQTFCYGLVVLRNASRRQVTLKRVQVHGGEGLQVGTPRVMGPRRPETIATADACPKGTKPLRGYVVPPGSGVGEDLGVEVLLPITVLRKGKSRIDGISVMYTSGGRSYWVDDITNVVACTYRCEARPGGR